jgi:hypothetical protein
MRYAAAMLAGLITVCLPVGVRAQTTRASFQDNYADVNGVRLHYASVGQGPLVLFLHGYPSFWYQWKDQMAEMGRDHLAVGLDTCNLKRQSANTIESPVQDSSLSREWPAYNTCMRSTTVVELLTLT